MHFLCQVAGVVIDGSDEKHVCVERAVFFHQLLGQFGQDGGVLFFLLAFGQLQILLGVLGKKAHQTDQMEHLLQPVGHHECMHTGPVISITHHPPLAEGVLGGVRVGIPHGHVLDPLTVDC